MEARPATSTRLDHWAFKAPVRPSLPSVQTKDWARNAIDLFVLQKLEQENLAPSPEADRRTLIRRVYFDVIGLPPTPEEVERFVADPSPTAYEQLVERLLASPRYGERWARHWLDVVRFAETHGFEMNQPRPNAWPYRDYIISAFNQDKPYDRFIMEQIAGDALGNDAATGFLVAGPWDQVKSPDEVLTKNQRADELNDMVNTTSTAFLGLTLGCARCHDHKFDPIPQRDYYAVKAVFEGVHHGERTARSLDDDNRIHRVDDLRKQILAIENRLSQFEPLDRTTETVLLGPPLELNAGAKDSSGAAQLVPRAGFHSIAAGSGQGQSEDPGNTVRLPNLSRGYSYWTNAVGKDLLSWKPEKPGRWAIWVSWGCGLADHASDARYVLDLDGDLQTRDDQMEIARVDQRHFADGTGEARGQTVWSEFHNAGIHQLRKESCIVLRGGETEGIVTADLILMQEVSGGDGSPELNLRSPVTHRKNVDRFEPVDAKFLRFTITQTTDAEPCLDELEVLTASSSADTNGAAPQVQNVALADHGTKATASGTYPGNEFHKLEHLNDGQYGNERSWISNERGKGWVQLEFPKTEHIDRVVWSRDRSLEPRFRDRLPTQYQIEVSVDGEHWKQVGSGDDRLPRSGAAKPAAIRVVQGVDAAVASELNGLCQQKEALEAELRRQAASPKIYAGEFEEPELTRRFNRGDPMQPREMVPPGGFSEIAASLPIPLLSTNTPERDRRLALARWIASPGNPLTARVMVNRIWQHHFGEGLVSTPSDFGRNGARPSHPELLDWLAAEMIHPSANGAEQTAAWSIKHIHRLILNSAVYRQSSAVRPDCLAKDGATRLLWRYPPQRLDAEPIRDSILSIVGRLDLRMGGPGWSPFELNENYVRVYNPKKIFEPSDFRRMVYATEVRQRPDGVFGTFDCPDGGQIAPKRTRSTTPLQALNLLNSGFMMQVADLFAERLRRDAGTDIEAEVKRAFLLAFGRAPEPEEIKAAASFIRDQNLKLFCRTLLNANELVYVF